MGARALVAFNPLPYYVSVGGILSPEEALPLPEIYRQIREAGFDAVHVDVPSAMPVPEYRTLLDDSGLAPAPGYFQAPFTDDDHRSDVVEAARRTAGHHAELGLSRIFIADQFAAEERLLAPAVGAASDDARLDRIIRNLTLACEAMVAEGVTPCLHQHVGTWIESEGETVAVLDGIDPGLLLFGPDTGHLSWAGVDPVAMIERHLDRVGAVHLKDYRRAIASEGLATGEGYTSMTWRHLWTEPGRGDVDFDGVLGVLANFDGWHVIEVDIADQPTVAETAKVSADWIRARLESTE